MHQQTPLISLIIPVYKTGKYLPDCINTILAQTYQNFEILLINDGSPDNSGEVCDRLALTDPRIRVFHKENGGVSSARNLGLDNAKGEYIAFVDSDDGVSPTFLEERYRNAVDTESDASICDFQLVEEGAPFIPPEEKPYEVLAFSRLEGTRNAIVCKYYAGSSCMVLFKRKLVEHLRFREDVHFAEDVLFVINALLRADRICYTKKPLYYYVAHPTSSSRTGFHEENMTLMDSCYCMKEVVRSHGVEKELGPAVDARTISCALSLIRRVLDDKKAQKIYAKRMQKDVQKHLSFKSLKCLAPVMRMSAVLAAIHYKLYIWAVKGRAKTK